MFVAVQVSLVAVELTPPVIISGAIGQNASRINGAYMPLPVVYNGRILYHKLEGDTWLRYQTEGGKDHWIISDTFNKNANNSSGVPRMLPPQGWEMERRKAGGEQRDGVGKNGGIQGGRVREEREGAEGK